MLTLACIAQVTIFKQARQIGLTCLQSIFSFTLEVQICFEVLSIISHPWLGGGELASQRLGSFPSLCSWYLIASDFRVPEYQRFLHLWSKGRTLGSCFCSWLFSECFITGVFMGGLLSMSTSSLTPLLLCLHTGGVAHRFPQCSQSHLSPETSHSCSVSSLTPGSAYPLELQRL